MIRQATTQDLNQIVALIHPFIDDFAVDDEGREKFNLQMILQLIEHPDIHYFVYLQANEIVGVMAYREPAHIVHFFVKEIQQGQGIGRALWNHMQAVMDTVDTQIITVNSSCFAEKIYRKMGFESVSDVIEAHGLRFIQMQKNQMHEHKV
ncbi:GNAT family N-acetyltransferase [Acinetobacter wanghuae]|uniref:GNAT family N-acetyltransferase n=1 Tax=Acinetobacter wanghuae TaxID=2662362 RepID=A0A5Q0P2T5_9GAMM|nr:GNAT family N-acetyltransferase [Acinetobacter wanghuae]MQW92576.1 GNAT family N-acetyltransferase [Acinetobacter wanghuae]QGA11084.1 GNAT family N-acetyltransferase [Acinetobacter wanghuae]